MEELRGRKTYVEKARARRGADAEEGSSCKRAKRTYWAARIAVRARLCSMRHAVRSRENRRRMSEFSQDTTSVNAYAKESKSMHSLNLRYS
jgi:hypothetical protein